MQIVVNNFHNDDLSWLPKGQTFIYDHKQQNFGYNIFDYMDWIVKNYDNLDDMVLFTKGNMLKRHITPEEWEKVKDNKTFTPLLTQGHKVDGVINYYKDGLYYEKNNFWYANHYGVKSKESFEKLIDLLGVRGKDYLGFSPGACALVPRDNILKHSKELYEKLRDSVSYSQTPGEAHLIERCLVYLWKDDIITP